MIYYSMNIGEILVLLFIIFLWVLSIVYCIKRYEKISTIERADMPTFNRKITKDLNMNNSIMSLSSSTSSHLANKTNYNQLANHVNVNNDETDGDILLNNRIEEKTILVPNDKIIVPDNNPNNLSAKFNFNLVSYDLNNKTSLSANSNNMLNNKHDHLLINDSSINSMDYLNNNSTFSQDMLVLPSRGSLSNSKSTAFKSLSLIRQNAISQNSFTNTSFKNVVIVDESNKTGNHKGVEMNKNNIKIPSQHCQQDLLGFENSMLSTATGASTNRYIKMRYNINSKTITGHYNFNQHNYKHNHNNKYFSASSNQNSIQSQCQETHNKNRKLLHANKTKMLSSRQNTFLASNNENNEHFMNSTSINNQESIRKLSSHFNHAQNDLDIPSNQMIYYKSLIAQINRHFFNVKNKYNYRYNHQNSQQNKSKILKSSSEPAFIALVDEGNDLNEGTNESKLIRKSTKQGKLLKTCSSEDNSKMVYLNDNFDANCTTCHQNDSSLHASNSDLLNPHMIPKLVRKSLIDLHKRSVWNLSHPNKLQQQQHHQHHHHPHQHAQLFGSTNVSSLVKTIFIQNNTKLNSADEQFKMNNLKK